MLVHTAIVADPSWSPILHILKTHHTLNPFSFFFSWAAAVKAPFGSFWLLWVVGLSLWLATMCDLLSKHSTWMARGTSCWQAWFLDPKWSQNDPNPIDIVGRGDHCRFQLTAAFQLRPPWKEVRLSVGGLVGWVELDVTWCDLVRQSSQL